MLALPIVDVGYAIVPSTKENLQDISRLFEHCLKPRFF